MSIPPPKPGHVHLGQPRTLLLCPKVLLSKPRSHTLWQADAMNSLGRHTWSKPPIDQSNIRQQGQRISLAQNQPKKCPHSPLLGLLQL